MRRLTILIKLCAKQGKDHRHAFFCVISNWYKRHQRSAQHYQFVQTFVAKSREFISAVVARFIFSCVFRFAISDDFVYRQILKKPLKMRFNSSEFSAVHRYTHQFGLLILVIVVVLSYHNTEATNYCKLCKDHVGCKNDGVCHL